MADLLSVSDAIDLAVKPPHLRAVPMFFYGTLREGQPLMHNVNVTSRESGWINGHSLYAYPRGHFPFCVQGGSGRVVGDLAWVTPNARLMELILMESRAGYDVAVVDVHTEHLNESTPALVFVYPGSPYGTERIDGGDWLEVTPWPTTLPSPPV